MRRCWWESLCSNERLHIRPDDIDHPAHLGRAPDIVHGGFLLSIGCAKRLDSRSHSNLGAELEAVCDGFRWAIDAQRSAFPRVGLDSKIESGLGEMNHSDWVFVQLRCPGASFDSEPDFEGVFRAEFMVPKGGRETENAKRNPLGKGSQWSAWMRSLCCCTPMSARRGRCGRDGLPARFGVPASRHGQRLLRRPAQGRAALYQTNSEPLLAGVRRLPGGDRGQLSGGRHHPSGDGQSEFTQSQGTGGPGDFSLVFHRGCAQFDESVYFLAENSSA